jgi:hypothetical protein
MQTDQKFEATLFFFSDESMAPEHRHELARVCPSYTLAGEGFILASALS